MLSPEILKNEAIYSICPHFDKNYYQILTQNQESDPHPPQRLQILLPINLIIFHLTKNKPNRSRPREKESNPVNREG